MSNQYSYAGGSKILYDVLMSMYSNRKQYIANERAKDGIPWTSIDKGVKESLEMIIGRNTLSEPYEYEGVVCLNQWQHGYCWESQHENVTIKPLPEYNHEIDGVKEGDGGLILEIERENETETFKWQTTIDEEEEEREFRIKQLKRERLAKEEKQKTDIDKLVSELQEWRKLLEKSLENKVK